MRFILKAYLFAGAKPNFIIASLTDLLFTDHEKLNTSCYHQDITLSFSNIFFTRAE